MDQSFYQTVVRLIPSADLKRYVRTHRFSFCEKDLLKIIVDYAPTVDEKISLLERASQVLQDRQMRLLAQRRCAIERTRYNAFVQTHPDVIYYIECVCPPYMGKCDIFAAKSFEDAVSLIKRFVSYYRIRVDERKNARYVIRRMTTNLPVRSDDFLNDKVGVTGRCVLDAKYRMLDLYMAGPWRKEVRCDRSDSCERCQRCIDMTFTRFPPFLKPYDLVGYYDHLIMNPKSVSYGIFCHDLRWIDPEPQVFALDSKSIRNRSIESTAPADLYDHIHHTHPSCFTIIKPDPATLSPQLLEDYAYAVSKLKEAGDELLR